MFYLVNEKLFDVLEAAELESKESNKEIKELSLNNSFDLRAIFLMKGIESVKRSVEVALVGKFSVFFYASEDINYELPFKYEKYVGKKDLEVVRELLNLSKNYDMFVELPRLNESMLINPKRKNDESDIEPMERVKKAQCLFPKVKDKLDEVSESILKQACFKFNFSTERIKTLKLIAKSICALDGKTDILPQHIAESIQYNYIS